LPVPDIGDLVTRWTPQPVGIAAAVIAAGWYVWSVRALRRPTSRWARRRSVSFGLGIVLLIWTTNGVAEVYSRSLYWIWTTQQLLLLLIVPVLLMAGQPIELARRTRGDRALPARLVDSGAGRFFANPLVGPVLIPVLSVALFFGPLGGWAIQYRAVGLVLPVVVTAIGALIVLPLVSTDDHRGSMAVAAALTIGVFELLLDAAPGIVLRLRTTIVTSYFDHRSEHSWTPTHLHDQQLGGAILWCVAELIDLPFLLLVYLRWLRADERDAREIDTVLEAERIALGTAGDASVGDAPWWHSDPTLRERFKQ
jgi:putative membrane protein